MSANQLAMAQVAEQWIEQSQALSDAEAVRRLDAKIALLQDKIHALSVAAFRDEEPPVEVAGLSVIDVMLEQLRLVVERAVRARFARMAA
jgi:cell envelope opacity-associated protein A